ncbi:MAG TPA: ABC transporter permease subunit [Clostridiaceae bacterium]|nr:ABC transporter permease subunit [Clostridiaceae bacterium]
MASGTAEKLFFLCACVSVLSVLIITIYIFVNGSLAIFKIGFFQFILGMEWAPGSEQFGILPMIVASMLGIAGALATGTCIGIFTAVFLAEIAPNWLVKIFHPAIELMAGIPSVVYGFFGLIVIVPLISKYFGGVGNSLLAVIIILGIMILPTIINISEAALRAVPKEYKWASLKHTGIGIPSEHTDRIFERFYKVDKGRSRSMDGTGLGLSIVKHIVNLYSGDIRVESQVGTGTEFIIQLKQPTN